MKLEEKIMVCPQGHFVEVDINNKSRDNKLYECRKCRRHYSLNELNYIKLDVFD